MAIAMGQREVVDPQYFPAHEVDGVVFYSGPTLICRARRKSNGMPVTLKTLRGDHTARAAAVLLEHEYEIAHRVNVPTVIRMFSLDRRNNGPVIELEDFGGDSLDHIAGKRRLPLEELLHVAIQLAQGLMLSLSE